MSSNLLTHSRLSCAKTCLRKHWYSYELGLRKETPSRPLRIGTCVHIGLDKLAKGSLVDDAIEAAVAGYAELPSFVSTEEAMHEWIVERETAANLVAGYAWRWGCDKGGLGEDIRVIQTEQSFRLPILNPETGASTPTYQLGGKIDKLIEWTENGRSRLAIMEHKTCSEDLTPDSDYWKRLRIDQQISLYFCAARDLGYDVQTVLYDVIRKPTISPKQIPLLDADGVKIVVDANGQRVRTKDGKKWRESGDASQGYTLQSRVETPREFGERLLADIGERPDFYFARVEIPRLDADLAEWRQELWDQQQAIRRCELREVAYRNTSTCLNFGRCEYLDICHNGMSLGDAVPTGFVRVENVHPELSDE